MPRQHPFKALLYISLAGLSLVLLAATVKALGPEVGIGAPIFFRGWVGVVVCLVWARVRRASLWPGSSLRVGLRCVTGAAAMFCYYSAIGNLAVELGTAAMLLKTAPIWVALLAPWTVGEPSGPRTWLALAIALVGAGIVYGGIELDERLGIGLCLLAGFLAGLAYLSLRGLAFTDDPAVIVLWFSVFLVVAAAPLLGPLWAKLPQAGPRLWGLLMVAGVTGALGQLFLTAAYRYGSAAAVTIGGLSEVGLATLSSVVLFDEAPAPLAFLGGALALTGGILANLDKPAPEGEQEEASGQEGAEQTKAETEVEAATDA